MIRWTNQPVWVVLFDPVDKSTGLGGVFYPVDKSTGLGGVLDPVDK